MRGSARCPCGESCCGWSASGPRARFLRRCCSLRRRWRSTRSANFPFSTKAWSNGFNPAQDLYGRFEDGIPPQKNGDYAFLLHILRSLKSTGRGAVILPHGVLFRGGAEGQIRRNLIRKGYIKGIIGLPANLFYGTGIPACIIVLDKENAAGRTGIFMINASQGFANDLSSARS